MQPTETANSFDGSDATTATPNIVLTASDAAVAAVDEDNHGQEPAAGKTLSVQSVQSDVEARPQGKTASMRSEDAARCSVDYDVLRAAPARKILWNFARVMRTNEGGDGTYKLSHRARIINQFWSHSWRANAAIKICTLILFYNGNAAAVASMVASGAGFVLVQNGMLSGKACLSVGCASHSDCPSGAYCDTQARCFTIDRCLRKDNGIDGQCPRYDEPVESAQFYGWPFLFGASVYLITVICWQARSLVFLDKVCIHQTDPEKKRKGIDGLGGFLSCSSQMVIYWDKTYFERLWCTFELAAYTYLKGDEANIPVVPVVRGLGMSTVLIISTVFYTVQITPLAQARPMLLITCNTVLMLFLALFGTHIGRHYARDRQNMRDQIQNFKISHAQCTCCEWGHINPFTDERIMCDREVVENAVKEWFVGGLEEFDRHVREGMYRRVVGRMPCIMGYRELVFASLPVVWFEMSKLAIDCLTPELVLRRCAVLCSYWFAFNPFIIALLLRLAALAQALHKDWRRDVAVTVFVSVAWAGLYAGFNWLQYMVYVLAPSDFVGALLNCGYLMPMTALLLRFPAGWTQRNGPRSEPHHPRDTPPKDLEQGSLTNSVSVIYL